MANQEIHIKDFYDIDDGFKWMEDVSTTYPLDIWYREVEVRLIHNGATQIMLTFKKQEPNFIEALMDDDSDITGLGDE